MADAINLPGNVKDYLYRVSVNEPDVLRRLREETSSDPRAGMQISPDVGAFLQVMVRALGVKRILEVGVFTGYSSTAMALALPPDGRIVACDVSVPWTNIARRYWKEAGVDGKIDLRIAPAIETLDGMIANGENGSFDFAFIDADKSNYWNYYERAMQLVRAGGVLAIDNVLWNLKVLDPSVNDEDTVAVRAFNERVHADDRVVNCMLAVRDGITLAVKR